MQIRRSFLGSLLFVGATSAAFGQSPHVHTPEAMHHVHRDAKAYIALLENPERDAYQKPAEVVAALGLKETEVVADVGSGSGYFTLRLAPHARRVYGVDVDPELVRHLNRRLRDASLTNVHVILADADDPLLPEPVDRFLIVNTWHHIEAQEKYLGLMRKALKPGGEVVMIDFHKKELPVGPPVAMKIAREDLVRQMEAGGFRLTKEHDFLPYQYFLRFQVGAAGRGN